jgi:leucyl aminopeptidase (aminopeptidase T)
LNFRLLHDAELIVGTFVQVKAGETVTLVTDHDRRDEAEALAYAVNRVGAHVIVVRADQHVAELLNGAVFWTAPPKHLIAAVQAADVSIFTVDETYAFRLDHHVRELFETGPNCSIYKVDTGMGRWGLTKEGLDEVDAIGRRIQDAFAGANEVHVTNPAGTDLRFSIHGRPCLAVTPIPKRGQPYGIPIPLWGEYNWAPICETVEGTLAIDGITEATTLLHVADEPILVQIRGGKAEVAGGGVDADAFRRILATDDGSSLVGEFGMGGNPNAIPGTETEKALLGTVHIGFGNNDEYPGGTVRSAVHVDGGVRRATIAVDGREVMTSGKLMV